MMRMRGVVSMSVGVGMRVRVGVVVQHGMSSTTAPTALVGGEGEEADDRAAGSRGGHCG
jgi:hypothetical protein